MQHDPFEPDFVVDVTQSWPAKMAALDAHESQLSSGRDAALRAAGGGKTTRSARREPATKVSSREFRLMIEGRARHFGQMVGVELGEPFWSRLPLAVADPWQLLPTGPR